jgi:hypothetical protein
MKNVIDEFGNECNLKGGYTGEVFKNLKKLLKNFDEYLFVIYSTNGDKTPIPLLKKIHHDNKILLWHSGENKRNNIYKIKGDYKHIFSNYYWDTKNTTSIPLGYFTETQNNEVIPIKERLYNISFIGCLNRNRLTLASRLSNINSLWLSLGLSFFKKTTLKVLNKILIWKWNRDLFQFNEDFNKGLDADLYHHFLKHTKIALCPRGWVNSETFRLYEAMKYGCVVISEELPDREYYKNIPIIQVKDWNDGLKIANNLIENEELLEKMSKDNMKYYQTHLSPKATANIIANTLNEKGV